MIKNPSHISETDILGAAADLTAAGKPFALVIVIEAQGSTSARTGSKAILDAEGVVVAGWVGGGCAESTVAHTALECLETAEPQIVDVDLDDEVLGAGMPCGGRMRVYVEPVVPPPTLWVLGHGRVAECLCHLGALMSLNVIVDDVMAAPDRYPDASYVIQDDLDYSALTPKPSDFVVIATQHRGDHESLRRLLANDVGYIALIASRKRTDLVISYLREAGFEQGAIDRIRAPAGIALGARTPEEIALSVIAEIVLIRRRRAAGTEARQPTPMTIVGRPLLRAAGE